MIDPFISSFVRTWMGRGLFFFWLAVTSPPLLFLGGLGYFHEEYLNTVRCLGIPAALVWVIGSLWLTGRTVHYVFDENLMFLAAVKCTLRDLRFKLAFLPLVGQLFTPDHDKPPRDSDDS